MRFNVAAFALAFGMWWGVGIFIMTWWLIGTGASSGEFAIIEQLYPGYKITPIGSIIGLGWGFVCGAICGGILAWLYNVFAERIDVGSGIFAGKHT